MDDVCAFCGAVLESGEYIECAACADDNDNEALAEFLQDRFDMETMDEWIERKENRW